MPRGCRTIDEPPTGTKPLRPGTSPSVRHAGRGVSFVCHEPLAESRHGPRPAATPGPRALRSGRVRPAPRLAAPDCPWSGTGREIGIRHPCGPPSLVRAQLYSTAEQTARDRRPRDVRTRYRSGPARHRQHSARRVPGDRVRTGFLDGSHAVAASGHSRKRVRFVVPAPASRSRPRHGRARRSGSRSVAGVPEREPRDLREVQATGRFDRRNVTYSAARSF